MQPLHIPEGHEPTRQQEDVFHQLALGCSSVCVQRLRRGPEGRFRATRFATDGSVIDHVIVHPDGQVACEDLVA